MIRSRLPREIYGMFVEDYHLPALLQSTPGEPPREGLGDVSRRSVDVCSNYILLIFFFIFSN